MAALEIAKFQDQLIKRLNEDAMVQLSHDTDVNGQTPATEAVLLFHQHGLSPHHHHHHHEWNFARAFLYSLTVLTTIGKFVPEPMNRSGHQGQGEGACGQVSEVSRTSQSVTNVQEN